MRAEAQRIAIHRALGWTRSGDHHNPDFKYVWRRGEEYQFAFPDYRNDLNAMAEAEDTLIFSQRQQYFRELQLIRSRGLKVGHVAMQECIRATAAERAEAFLRTLGLWKEEA